MSNIEKLINSVQKEETNTVNDNIVRYVKKWPIFAASIAAGILLGLFLYKATPSTYQVESKILIKGESNPLSTNITLDNIMGMGKPSSNMSNQIEILQSFTNYKQAIENLSWETTWYLKQRPYNVELYKSEPFKILIPKNSTNKKGIPIYVTTVNDQSYSIFIDTKVKVAGIERKLNVDRVMKYGEEYKDEYFNFVIDKKNVSVPENTTYFFKFNNKNDLAQSYLEKVEAEVTNLTSDVIKMTLEGNIPQKEVDFLNELNSVFINQGIEIEDQNSENSISFINSQLSQIRDSLSIAEQNYSSFREKNKVLDLSQEANVIYQKSEEIENERYQAEQKMAYYLNLQKYIDDSDKIEQIFNPSLVGVGDANLNGMLQSLMELYARREILSFSVQKQNPSYIMLEKEIDITKKSLNENLKNLINNANIELSSINKRYREIQSRLTKLPETEKELIGIQREFDLSNKMYNYLLQRKAEAELSKASTSPQVQIIDPALTESSERIGPSLIMNVAMGFSLGFMIPFFIIFIAGLFNMKILSADTYDDKTQLPIFKGIIHAKQKSKLPTKDHPRSGISESFRSLRYNVRNHLDHPEEKVISVLSMVPGEGKSFVASNLATSLSLNDKKVLLVGADIRKPKLESLFGEKNGTGLSSFLSGDHSFNDVVIEGEIPNLSFVSSGGTPQNPSELLENGKIEDFIRQARNKFDYIVLDNAPAKLVSDGLIISKQSDLSLYVVRLNHSHVKTLKDIEKLNETNEIKKSMLVMNDVPSNGYSKGYGKYGYGNYSDKK